MSAMCIGVSEAALYHKGFFILCNGKCGMFFSFAFSLPQAPALKQLK